MFAPICDAQERGFALREARCAPKAVCIDGPDSQRSDVLAEAGDQLAEGVCITETERVLQNELFPGEPAAKLGSAIRGDMETVAQDTLSSHACSFRSLTRVLYTVVFSFFYPPSSQPTRAAGLCLPVGRVVSRAGCTLQTVAHPLCGH